MKYCFPLILAVVVLITAAGCVSLTSDSQSTGTALFNGKNLDGWTIQNNGRFSVEDGVIKINRGTGWLRSVETYSDFKLVMEFRFLEANANSGIFVRTGPTSSEEKEGWPDNGYQIQCKDTIAAGHTLLGRIS